MRGLGARSTSISSLLGPASRVAPEAPTRYRERYRNAICVAAEHFFPGAFHSGQALQKDLALQSRQHLTYSRIIIQQDIPQGVLGPHKLEPIPPQLHSDFTPGCCRSFRQVFMVSRADGHLHSARQSSIIFMLLNQSSCR